MEYTVCPGIDPGEMVRQLRRQAIGRSVLAIVLVVALVVGGAITLRAAFQPAPQYSWPWIARILVAVVAGAVLWSYTRQALAGFADAAVARTDAIFHEALALEQVDGVATREPSWWFTPDPDLVAQALDNLALRGVIMRSGVE